MKAPALLLTALVAFATAAPAMAAPKNVTDPGLPRSLSAGTGAIGLLVVTLTSLARPVADINPGLLVGSLFVGLAARRVHPLLLLAGAITAGAITASLLN